MVFYIDYYKSSGRKVVPYLQSSNTHCDTLHLQFFVLETLYTILVLTYLSMEASNIVLVSYFLPFCSCLIHRFALATYCSLWLICFFIFVPQFWYNTLLYRFSVCLHIIWFFCSICDYCHWAMHINLKYFYVF